MSEHQNFNTWKKKPSRTLLNFQDSYKKNIRKTPKTNRFLYSICRDSTCEDPILKSIASRIYGICPSCDNK